MNRTQSRISPIITLVYVNDNGERLNSWQTFWRRATNYGSAVTAFWIDTVRSCSEVKLLG